MDTTELKVYTAQVITDVPFELEGTSPIDTKTSQSSANETYGPATIDDQSLPPQRVARILLSDSLNTVSKKILQEYQFTQQGAIQVGEYQSGVSGDIRISPNGITARDLAGNTTFDLDGDTGDAAFKGRLEAGSIVAGDGNIVMEESSKGNGRIVFYNAGIPAIVIGDPS